VALNKVPFRSVLREDLEVSTWPSTLNTKDKLTPREIDVLQLIADGKANKEIGDHL